jgi:hypothetical protein
MYYYFIIIIVLVDVRARSKMLVEALKYILLFFTVDFSSGCEQNGSFAIEYRLIDKADLEVTQTAPVITSLDNTKAIVTNHLILHLCNSLLNITNKIDRIEFVGCNIEDIEENCFRGQKIDKTISIFGNKISMVKRHTFVDLDIEILSLTSNSIEVIEDEAFLNLPNLNQLSLNSNHIGRLNPYSFVQTPKLKYLDLMRNKIKILTLCFRFIEEDNADVWLSHNRIDLVEENVFEGVSGTNLTLSLSYNLIETLPDGIFANRSFITIDLTMNPVRDLSKNICTESCKIEYLLLDPECRHNADKEFLDWALVNRIKLSNEYDEELSWLTTVNSKIYSDLDDVAGKQQSPDFFNQASFDKRYNPSSFGLSLLPDDNIPSNHSKNDFQSRNVLRSPSKGPLKGDPRESRQRSKGAIYNVASTQFLFFLVLIVLIF